MNCIEYKFFFGLAHLEEELVFVLLGLRFSTNEQLIKEEQLHVLDLTAL